MGLCPCGWAVLALLNGKGPSIATARTVLLACTVAALLLCDCATTRSAVWRATPARGINLGNALEAPIEGQWGVVLDDSYFAVIRNGGFDFVRIPICWSAHALAVPPYTVDPAFFARVDWAIDQARANDLTVVIDVHHYDALFADPDGQRDRFLSIWRQIAERYRAQDDALVFEILNEPHDRLQGTARHELMQAALAVIRESNPNRWVVIDGDAWGGVQGLSALLLPEEDRRLIGSFHYYEPFRLTHQGAEWVSGSFAWLGTTWSGTPAEQAAVRRDLDRATRWAEQYDRPVLLGEFGVYERANMASRVAWTAFVAREAEARGFSWAYWEFGAGFGVYDRETRTYRPELHAALVPDRP